MKKMCIEQVFGYADPNGWPGVRIGHGSHDNAGVLHGSLTLYDLSLGAVRIRLRALSPDGRDATCGARREATQSARSQQAPAQKPWHNTVNTKLKRLRQEHSPWQRIRSYIAFAALLGAILTLC